MTWTANTSISGNWLARALGGRKRKHAYRRLKRAVR